MVVGLPKETKGKLDHYSDPFNQDNESHFKTAPPLMSNGEAQECQFSEGLGTTVNSGFIFISTDLNWLLDQIILS